MNDKVCPACSDTDLKKNITKKIITEPFGGSKEVEITNYYCNTCGFEGDLFDENDRLLQESRAFLKQSAVETILDDFVDNHYNLAGIERALEIPQRTLSKWKSGATNPSSPGIALLKFLRLFPWLIEVAEQKYEYGAAQKIHMADALNQFLNRMNIDDQSLGNESTTTLEVTKITITKTIDEPNQSPADDDYGFEVQGTDPQFCLEGSI